MRLASVTVLIGLQLSQPLNSRKSSVASSDESGTLVMAGWTSEGVAVSVDSRVTNSIQNVDGTHSYSTGPTRKLVEIGKHSACALSGFLGRAERNNRLSQSIADWANLHPANEITQQNLADLLNLGIASWNQENYPPENLPAGRRRGDTITEIICGTMLAGQPELVIGRTAVGPDGRAVVGQMPANPWFAYLSGVLTSTGFRNLVESDTLPPTIEYDRGRLEAIRKATIENASAIQSFKTVFLINGIPKKTSPTAVPNLRDMQVLFEVVYASVEDNYTEVGPPNNVRLILPCGRWQTVIEGRWHICHSIKR